MAPHAAMTGVRKKAGSAGVGRARGGGAAEGGRDSAPGRGGGVTVSPPGVSFGSVVRIWMAGDPVTAFFQE